MLNKVVIMGRMVKDIELRQTQSSKTVGTFTVAVDDGYGEKKTTDFIDCVAWEKTAGFIHNHFGKGRVIVIVGKIKTRTWEDNDGNKRKPFARRDVPVFRRLGGIKGRTDVAC